MVIKIRDMQRLEGGQRPQLGGEVLLPSESAESNIELVEQSPYYWKYDKKAWLMYNI